MVRLSVATLIVVVVSYAILIAVLLFVLDKYLDLRVVSYTTDTTRQATNLLHLILTSSSIAEDKLVIKESEIDSTDYTEEMWLAYPITETKKHWMTYYDILEYDFNFSVSSGGWEKQFGNLIFDMTSMCYRDYQKIKGYAEIPASLYYRGFDVSVPAIANLTLMISPVSELSFWISQTSLRIEEEYDSELLKTIQLGPEVSMVKIQDKSDEMSNTGIVCMNVSDNWVCKYFSFEPGLEINVCRPGGDLYVGTDCVSLDNVPIEFYLADRNQCKEIQIKATQSSIDVILPGSTNALPSCESYQDEEECKAAGYTWCPKCNGPLSNAWREDMCTYGECGYSCRKDGNCPGWSCWFTCSSLYACEQVGDECKCVYVGHGPGGPR